MLIDQEIMPIILDNNFIPYIGQYNDNHSRKIRGLNFSLEDIKSFFLTFFSKNKPPERIIFDLDKYRLELIRQISNRDRKTVVKQWEECGIDQDTAEYYMDHFGFER